MRKTLCPLAICLMSLFLCGTSLAAKSKTVTIYRFYKSTANPNHYIAYGDIYGDPLFRSENGKDFRPLVMTGFAGNYLKHKLSFRDPFSGDKKGGWEVDGDKLVLEGETFLREQISQTGLIFHPFLKARVPMYIFQDASGKDFFLYISTDKYKGSRKSLRFFIGSRQHLKEVKITESHFCICGQIMDINTDAGTLYAEDTHFLDKAPKFTWGKMILKELNPEKFVFKENGTASFVPR